MRKTLFAATALALSAACHSRNEDEVGAAPDPGDTTATVNVIDTTRTGPPGVGGRPGNATVTPDSTDAGSVLTREDSAATPTTTDTTSWTPTPQDTVGAQQPGMADSTMGHDSTMMGHDSTMMRHDSTMMHGDSAMTNHPVPDSSTAR